MLDKIDLPFEPSEDEVDILCCGSVVILGIAEDVGFIVIVSEEEVHTAIMLNRVKENSSRCVREGDGFLRAI